MAWDYTNDYSSTILAYTSGAGAITVVSVTGLPASGKYFILKVDNEYFLCTSYTGLVLTVTGGQAGSTPANHSLGATITGCWIVPSVLDGIRADQSQVGIATSRPSSGMKKGDLYVTSDTGVLSIYNGSAWISQPFPSTFTDITITPSSTTSYSNPQGQGDRRATITVYISGRADLGYFPLMVDGVNLTNSGMGDWIINNGDYAKIYFGAPVLITEISVYAYDSQGSTILAKWWGSNDDASYTLLGSDVTYGDSSIVASPVVDSTISGNTTFYKYYKLIKDGGGGNFKPGEFTFKIAQAPSSTLCLTVNGESSFSNMILNGVTSQPPIVITHSATPVFDLSAGNIFSITLAENEVQSIANQTSGQLVLFLIYTGSGGFTFTWDSLVKGAMTISASALKCNVQLFISDGTNLYAVTPGVVGQ